jgi:hypothetical protein
MHRAMKTIAVTIDEPTLDPLDRIALGLCDAGPRRVVATCRARRLNRSALARIALQQFVARHEGAAREVAEQRVFAKHRKRLARRARALVAERAVR